MSVPDYYKVLNVPRNASPDQIKTGYKKASLRCHPDRIPSGQPDSDAKKKKATKEFQVVADAYFTLSDPTRKASYDRLSSRAGPPPPEYNDYEDGPPGGFWDYFSEGTEGTTQGERPDAEHVFGDAFEDMMRDEVHRRVPLWTWSGGAAGAVIGFIAGNLPGAALGAVAGSKLGSIRDAKGKAVYQVFQDLPGNERQEVLKALAAKVFGYAASRVA